MVDKTSECGNHNHAVVAQVGLRVPNTGATVSAPASTWPGGVFVLRWPIVPKVAPRGPAFARGA